ncbi:PKD domain-containing protein [Polaribacter cellanae]|uniref:PKD/Chitinase domain-containing protein n=1 Tax=Polaribacter cellanae TaxID=2818493 RepID=A0A975H6X5_9FLAO|nr:hypothetical protein [Polaribacter cellanae]QTE22468.1 hypothetical protein J3359_16945 [Polaribacter cellanae]
MKKIKTIYKALLILLIINACTEEKNLDFLDNIPLPSNVAVSFKVTQDNTGVVTMSPSAEGATSFDVYLGDGTAEPVKLEQGKTATHTYAEGTYDVKLVAFNSVGKTTELTESLVVSFQAPQNLVVTIENDAAVSKQVNIKAEADFAATYEFYSGESGVTQPVATANNGDVLNYQYQTPGTYDVKVVAKGGAIATTEYTATFEVTEILAPLKNAPNPAKRATADVVSIFSDAYTNVNLDELPTSWSITNFEATTIDGNNVWKLTSLDFLGIVTNYGNGIDVSKMEKLHIDYWVPDGTTNELSVKIVNTIDGGEDVESLGTTVGGSWQSVELDMTGFEGGNLSNKEKITQILIDSDGIAGVVYVDNFYFYKSPSAASVLAGTWKVAAEPGSLKVGPSSGSGDWFSIDAAGVAQRACYFDDEYVFGKDFSFKNVLGNETWLEGWQGSNPEACGAPVAPHNGGAATFTHDAANNKVTITGSGAFLGLPKVNNAGELPNVAVPTSITYDITLSNNNTEMEVRIEAGSGVFWTYKMIKDTGVTTTPIDGTWKVAAKAGSLRVGPSAGSGEWFSIDEAGVTQRACYFDDEYVFNAGGSFENKLGTDTWLEGWQGATPDACGTPVAPHNGSTAATFEYDASANTIKLNGKGAYLGLPKVNNATELTNPADAPDSITYNVTLSNNNTEMEIIIEVGSGVFWTYNLVKQ